MKRLTRREVVENCITRGLLVAGIPMSQTKLLALWEEGQAQASKPTPTEVLGPFYKKGAPNTANLHKPGDPGFPLRVTGKVYNTKGEPVPGAKVDVWQADHVGRYDLEGYRYRAQLLLESKTEYTVETILPGHYDDRPAQHIHYLITAPGHRTLITQAYFASDPFFEGNPAKHHRKRNMVSDIELIRPVVLFEAPGAPRAAITFDICMEKL
jgi:protocatechuate 3,4-dioxygenase beta subunit